MDREDGSQWTPLQRVAALRGNPKVAKALTDAGADVNRCDGNQTTVLMVSDGLSMYMYGEKCLWLHARLKCIQ